MMNNSNNKKRSFIEWGKQTFSALQNNNYRQFWISQMLSQTGAWMQATAQQYLVLELSHNSGAALGMVTTLQFLPTLFLSLWAGALIDRLPRRWVLLSTQSIFLTTSSLLAFMTYTGNVNLRFIMVMAVCNGIANAFDVPARQSMVVDFVPRSQMANAVALNSLAFNVSRTLGQSLFGLVAALGTYLFSGRSSNISHLSLPFFFNVASFFYVIYVLSVLPFPKKERGGRKDIFSDIAEGISFIVNHQTIKNIILLAGALSLTILNYNIIVPYYSRAVFEATEGIFGLLSGVFGFGAVLGALWQAGKPNPQRNIKIGMISMLLGGSLLAFTTNPWVALPLFLISGFGMLCFLVSANSTVQMSIPDHLRGRVMSVYSFVLIGLAPAGAYLTSHLIGNEWGFGSRNGLLLLNGLGLVTVLLFWDKLPSNKNEANIINGVDKQEND